MQYLLLTEEMFPGWMGQIKVLVCAEREPGCRGSLPAVRVSFIMFICVREILFDFISSV